MENEYKVPGPHEHALKETSENPSDLLSTSSCRSRERGSHFIEAYQLT